MQLQNSHTIVTPSQTELERIIGSSSRWRELSDLLVITDVLDIERYREGHIQVKRSAVILNNERYDLPVMHSTNPMAIPAFYNIPVLTCDEEDESEIIMTAHRSFAHTGERRHIIWTPGKNEPYLLETVLENRQVRVRDRQYISTSYAELANGSEETKTALRERVRTIVQDLKDHI